MDSTGSDNIGAVTTGDSNQILLPVDGKQAWKFLAAATIVEAILWAFPLAFGVFQNYYSELPEFHGNGNIAVIGTVPTAMFYLGVLFATPLIQSRPQWQQPMILIGCMLCVGALVAASFASEITHLIITQGFLYGAGFLILYPPILSMLNEWFFRHRGLAYGILYAGAGASGIGYPLMLEALLSKYGYRTTLRAVAVGQCILVGPVIPFLRSRLPAGFTIASRTTDVSFLQKPLFYCYAVSNLFQGFAFFIPGLYLPSYASSIGYPQTSGALLLALNNVAQILGQVAFGYMSDRTKNILSLVFLSSFVSSIATFTLWGLAQSLVRLIFYAIIYGLFAGGYVVLWPRFGTALTEDPRTVYNLMAFEKGLGNIAIGPISAKLLQHNIDQGYGAGRYELLILFTASSMLCSSMGLFGWYLRRREDLPRATAGAEVEL